MRIKIEASQRLELAEKVDIRFFNNKIQKVLDEKGYSKIGWKIIGYDKRDEEIILELEDGKDMKSTKTKERQLHKDLTDLGGLFVSKAFGGWSRNLRAYVSILNPSDFG